MILTKQNTFCRPCILSTTEDQMQTIMSQTTIAHSRKVSYKTHNLISCQIIHRNTEAILYICKFIFQKESANLCA